MKFLLFVIMLAVIWWIWSKKKRRPQQPVIKENPVEKMVVCAHCQLHLPESDSLRAGDDYYCCEAHRLAGGAKR